MSTPAWHTPDFPELRDGPPWVMQEMMALQPGLGPALLDDPPAAAGEIAAAARETLAAGDAVVVTGCGTSEHGAHGIAAILRGSVGAGERARVAAAPALTAALEPRPGLCLAVSHDGGTHATRLALDAAGAAGARTAVVTAKPDGAVAAAADIVLVTPVADRSWCHTVAYTSALLAGAAIAGRLGSKGGGGLRGADAERLLRGGLDAPDPGGAARALAAQRVVLCAGAGPDHVTARELALKIAEGARMPTVALELETVLHGQLAGHDGADALILVATAPHDRVARRAPALAAAAAAIGIPVAGVLSSAYADGLDTALTPAGRVVLPAPPDAIAPDLAALLAGATAAQNLALELAHARGTNPDLIRREEQAYREAAAAAEAAGDW